MIELVKFFRILFLSDRISRQRLKDFTEDHVLRLTDNNPGGIFTSILTDVTAAYNAYYGDFSSSELNLSVQEGKTVAMNQSREALISNISDNEKLIAYTYRLNPGVYEEFYPLGLNEYHQATLGELETISDRYKSVLASHAADFAPVFITDFNTAQQTYIDNRAAQTTAKASVAAESSDISTTRIALGTQLTKNLLTIALQFLGDETKADVYFNQAILNEAFKQSETRITGDINPGETLNVFSNITTPDLLIRGKNTGQSVWYIGFKNSPDEPCTEEDKAVHPGDDGSAPAGEGGWTTERKYLNISLPVGSVTGQFLIEKI